jgi:arabinogalactan oligomer/maltooligosaccharide transport system substrate-binding protein
MPRMKFATNAVLGTVVAMSLVFSTISVAGAHTARQAKGTLVICDFFPSSPANTPERVAELKAASAWGAKNGYAVQEPVPPSTGCNGQLTAGAKAGKAADINLMPDDQEGTMWGDKLIAPISLKTSDYVKSGINGVTNNGKIFGVPWALETMMIYYNPKLVPASVFKNATWDSLAKWSAAFAKSHPGDYGMAWQWDNFYYSYTFLTAYGGGIFGRNKKGYDKTKILLDSAGSVKGLEYLKHIIDDSGTPVNAFLGNSGNSNYPALFQAGRLAMVFDGPWSDQQWKTAHISYGVAAPPKFPSGKYGYPFLGVQTLVVNKYSAHLKAAESLAVYLSQHAAVDLFNASGRIPAYKPALKQVANNRELKQYQQAFKHTQAMPNIPEMDSYVWTPAGAAFTSYFTGKETASSALKTAAAAIRKSIASNG